MVLSVFNPCCPARSHVTSGFGAHKWARVAEIWIPVRSDRGQISRILHVKVILAGEMIGFLIPFLPNIQFHSPGSSVTKALKVTECLPATELMRFSSTKSVIRMTSLAALHGEAV
jgi:hypothetical protein